MEFNKELFDKFETFSKYKRQHDPLYVEMDKIVASIYPTKPLEDMFKLGQAHIISWIKNDLFQHMYSSDQDMFEYIIETMKNDEVMKYYLDKLIKS